ncbi:urea ABC transporter permease subunit UrtB [Achromobacter xylosoxidans]|uniref:Urea ABC transporter permease subunit UrtB n=1 Tax=Alcaligenes xylosoxydans xylosoxydans TaxID=85698 RepID=A0A2L0PU10_ALCXX|nr:urea ABC transporter permease subunit UrtB [Achromobacter xylosoxidans]AUZ18190.1 urea ABC transporter permease subunit UrtB [Achromobacter xylosoxidans]
MLNAVIAKFLRHLLLAWLLALPALAAQAAAPGVDPALLAPLAGDDTDARLQAIAALGQQPGPGAAAVLQALGNDQLYALPDGRVLIGDGKGQATDPATGATLPMPAEASGIGINNRLRRAIEAALAGSRLFSDNPQERLAAARRLQQTGDPARLPLLEKALAAEKDAAVRAALEIAQANLELKSADPAVRRHAVDLLGRTDNAAFRPTLAALTQQQDGVYAEPDTGVREAAANALKRIDRHLATIEWAGNLFYGLSLGSVLLLAALGLAITFGLMGVINMAHGELLMIGAYVTYLVQTAFRAWLPGWLDWYVAAALPLAFVVTALVGMALERTVIRWLYGRPLETLLATWGISLMLMQGVRTLFGAQNVEVGNPSWMSGGVTVLGGLVLTYNRLVIIGFALFVVFLVWALLNHTRLGLFVRAITQNRRMADCVGVPTGRVDMLAFGLGSGIAGLAGVALSQLGNVGPDLGRGYIVDSFMVVVLGGVGQLAGTVIAALGLGGVNKFLEPYAGAVMAKITILVLIVLFVQKRPQGLFAPRGRSVE